MVSDPPGLRSFLSPGAGLSGVASGLFALQQLHHRLAHGFTYVHVNLGLAAVVSVSAAALRHGVCVDGGDVAFGLRAGNPPTPEPLPLQRANEFIHLIHYRPKLRLRRRIAHGKWDGCHRVRIACRAGNLTRQRRVRHFPRCPRIARWDRE